MASSGVYRLGAEQLTVLEITASTATLTTGNAQLRANDFIVIRVSDAPDWGYAMRVTNVAMGDSSGAPMVTINVDLTKTTHAIATYQLQQGQLYNYAYFSWYSASTYVNGDMTAYQETSTLTIRRLNDTTFGYQSLNSAHDELMGACIGVDGVNLLISNSLKSLLVGNRNYFGRPGSYYHADLEMDLGTITSARSNLPYTIATLVDPQEDVATISSDNVIKLLVKRSTDVQRPAILTNAAISGAGTQRRGMRCTVEIVEYVTGVAESDAIASNLVYWGSMHRIYKMAATSHYSAAYL